MFFIRIKIKNFLKDFNIGKIKQYMTKIKCILLIYVTVYK